MFRRDYSRSQCYEMSTSRTYTLLTLTSLNEVADVGHSKFYMTRTCYDVD